MKFNLADIKSKLNSEKIKELSKKIFQDKYEKILQDLIELEAENPEDVRVKQKIAEIHYKKDRTSEAVSKYQEIADYFEKKNFILKAIKACKSILKIKPDLIPYNIKLASLYLKANMVIDAANQYRIAINHYANLGDKEKTLALAQDLVKVDPSNDNRAKLAEIYQGVGMIDEAVKQYEILAKSYRTNKNFAKLLFYYELILPHQAKNKAILKDVCVLHLRNKRPERALKIMAHYKALDDGGFQDLIKKSKLMQDAIKKNKIG